MRHFSWYIILHFSNRWYYQSEDQLGGSSYQGWVNNYGGGGFVMDLGSNPSDTSDILTYLFNNTWIDSATRAIFIDFFVYNANINLFCQIK